MTRQHYSTEDTAVDSKERLVKVYKVKPAPLAAGFAKGFGTVACIFPGNQPARKNDLKLSGWSRKSLSSQTSAINKAKYKLVSRHVGGTVARKICSVPTAMGQTKSYRCDVLMMHSDWRNAACKLHG